jgi:indoleamine 2,3-dioxygenase
MSIDNMTLIYSLDSTRDLEVFLLIPLLVELASVQAVRAIITAQQSLAKNDTADLLAHLSTIKTSLQNMRMVLRQMSPGCNPEVFYHQHRPLLSGWEDNPSMPDGLLYEGVSSNPLKYSGGSAAQSSAVQVIDAGLGVCHSGREGKFLVRMRNYMPPHQAGLIKHVAQGPSIRDACLSATRELKDSYNECLKALGMLRTEHLILVARYITTPSNMNRGEADHLADQGTGGTALATFLKRIRQDTAGSWMDY